MLSYTCFSVFGELGQVRGIGPKYCNHGQGYIESDAKCSVKDQIIPVLGYLGDWAILGNSTQIGHIIGRDTQSDSACLTPHFTSNRALLKFKDYLRMKCIWGIRGELEELDPNNPQHGDGYTESGLKSSTPHVTSDEA